MKLQDLSLFELGEDMMQLNTRDFNNISQRELTGKRAGFRVSISTIVMAIFLFILILPDDVFARVTLYESKTPSSMAYIWLNYKFGILSAILLVGGILFSIKLRNKSVCLIAGLMFVREIFYFLITDDNVFIAKAFEIYLTLFLGYSIYVMSRGLLRTREKIELFFKWFLVTNMLTLYINFAMGGSGGRLVGRYHASNLDVGGTGSVCVLCIIILAYSQRKKWYDYALLLLSVLGLILSGSRANLVFLAVLIGVGLVVSLNFVKDGSIERTKLIKKIVLYCVSLTLLLVIGIVYGNQIVSYISRTRYVSLLTSEAISGDQSAQGRLASITAGLDVLKKNPLGISGYFINLQSQMQLRRYPTFPHSTLLSMYLLIGPIILVVYFKLFSVLRKLKHVDVKYYLIVFYLVLSTILYGSPIVNFKVIFMLLLAMWLAIQSANEHETEINN